MTSPDSWVFVGNTHPNLDDEYKERNGSLLDGEKVLDRGDSILEFPQLQLSKKEGTLYVTNLLISFVYKDETNRWTNESTNVPHSCINSITYSDPSHHVHVVEIKTKDLRFLRLVFDDSEMRNLLVNLIERLSFWKKCGGVLEECVFAFSHHSAICRKGGFLVDVKKGLYDVEEEFQRQKLSLCNFMINSSINEHYSVCSTYPKRFILPRQVTDKVIRESANFRSHSRFPVICWVHPHTKATISRCSQPMTGMAGYGSESDELLVASLYEVQIDSSPRSRGNSCRKTTPTPRKFPLGKSEYISLQAMATSPYPLSQSSSLVSSCPEEEVSVRLYIIDARSKMAAKFNYAKGGGHENEVRYPFCAMKFMAIHNIHHMRNSYRSLTACIQESYTPDRSAIEQTGWLNHTKALLDAASSIARLVHKGKCVMVHCSDGWDRTSQVVSLTELLLDPYYRTLHGFGILIQKEWLQFGHKFADRVGHGEPEDFTNEQSPIFFQFLDCVYQLLCQYPNWFEFRENYLIVLIDQVYSGRFGTFLLNSEAERERADIYSRTQSLWSWLLEPENITSFRNPDYRQYNQPIFPNCATSRLNVWLGYYERYKSSMKQQHQHNAYTQRYHNMPKLEFLDLSGDINPRCDSTHIQEILYRVFTENQLLKEKSAIDSKKIAYYEMMLHEALQGSDTERDDSPKGHSPGIEEAEPPQADPPQVTKYVSLLDSMIHDDYDPSRDRCPHYWQKMSQPTRGDNFNTTEVQF